MSCSCNGGCADKKVQKLIAEIKEVRYNGPATIIFWGDGTKTVVKCCDEDINNPVIGYLMAVNKKVMSSNAYHELCQALIDIYPVKKDDLFKKVTADSIEVKLEYVDFTPVENLFMK